MATIRSSGQLTLTDLNDAIISGTAPTNPSVGTLWVDQSTTPSTLKKWNGSSWDIVGEIMDSGTGTTIINVTTTLGNMANDSVIDIKERQVVKDRLVEILGYTIADTATTLPTTATLDASLKGSFYNIRKSAVNAGISSSDTGTASGAITYGATYDALVTKYNSLKSYLEGLTPIDVWDVSTAKKDSNVTVNKSTWRDTWQAYYQAEYDLSTATARKLKENVDNVSVGGRNLYLDSYLARVIAFNSNATFTRIIASPSNQIKMVYTSGANYGFNQLSADRKISYTSGKQYTLSFEARGTASNLDYTYLMRSSAEGANSKFPITPVTLNDTTWTKISFLHTAPWSTDTGFVLIGSADTTAGNWFEVRNVKIEIGNKATDWTPSNEDLEKRMVTVEQSITEDAIVSTVTGSSAYITRMNVIDQNISGAGVNLVYNSIGDIKDTSGNTDGWRTPIRTNQVVGTGTSKTVTGTGGTNQTANIYDLDYAVVYNKQMTISFDAISTVNSGTFTLQWNATPWGTLGGAHPVSTTSKHYVYTVTQSNAGTGTAIQVRLDNVTGDVTISNLKVELGSTATAWNISPLDNIEGQGTNVISDYQDGYFCFRIDNANAGELTTSSKWIPVTPNTKYTMRFLAKQTSNMANFDAYFLSRKSGSTKVQGIEYDYIYQAVASKTTSTSGFTEFKYTFTTKIDDIDGFIRFDNNKSNDGEVSTLWIAELKLEKGDIASSWSRSVLDVDAQLALVTTSISNVKQQISDGSIVTTVTSSETFQNALSGKADASDLTGLITANDLPNLIDVPAEAQEAVKDLIETDGSLINTTYATKSELSQTSTDITAKFSATGGMNLLRNSIGFADFVTKAQADSGVKNWFVQGNVGRASRVKTTELDTLGFGSGLQFAGNVAGQQTSIDQYVTVVPNIKYTLSWYALKSNASPVSATNHDGELQIYMYEDGTTNKVPLKWSTKQEDGTVIESEGTEFVYANEYTNANFEPMAVTFTPTSNRVQLRLYAFGLTVATVTGLMFSIGDVPLQWTLSTGETYNTNVRLDINGIRVSQLNASKNEIGFTQITPSEFAGYYDANEDGNFEKVFYLNGEETVSKKVRAIQEFTMGTLKITKVPKDPDWLPLSPYFIGQRVAVGTVTYECTVGGITSSTPPSHTAGTATNGTVTWKYISTSSYIGWAFVPV